MHLHYDHYGRLVLQRWDQGAGRIPDLQVYGPTPLARISEQLFGPDGIYGPDIAARTQHRSSLDVFEARGGTLPRRRRCDVWSSCTVPGCRSFPLSTAIAKRTRSDGVERSTLDPA